MEMQILVRNMRLSDRSEDYIQKKIARLERHLRERVDAKLELSRTAARSETDRFVAQMTISTSGATLRGQESGLTLFAAVDAVDGCDGQADTAIQGPGLQDIAGSQVCQKPGDPRGCGRID